MARFRSHVSRWQRIKIVAMILFAAAVIIFNAVALVQGVATGAVETLGRSHRLIHADVEPGWFALNIGTRTIGEIVFVGGLGVWWRKFREDLRS